MELQVISRAATFIMEKGDKMNSNVPFISRVGPCLFLVFDTEMDADDYVSRYGTELPAFNFACYGGPNNALQFTLH